MDLNFLLLIITILVNVILAFFVYLNNPKSATNIIYGLLSIVTSVWLVVFYLPLIPVFSQTSLFLIRLSLFFAVPQVILFFLLSKTIPSEKLQLGRKGQIFISLWTLFVMGITISPFAFTRVEIINSSPQPIPGPGLPIFAVTVIFFSLFSIYNLVKRFLRSKGLLKEQIRYVMFGILLMLGLLITTVLLPVAIFQSSIFVPLAPLYTLIFLGATGYSIIRHKLFDIRLVVARAVAYTLLVVILGIFYTGTVIIATSLFLGSLSFTSQIVLYTTLTLIVSFTFHPLRSYLEKITDKIFFKGKYDSQELLFGLTKTMATTLRLGSVTEGILLRLVPEMRISKAAFVLVEKGKVTHVNSTGFDKKTKFTGIDILSLLETEKILFVDDLKNSKLKRIMQELEASVSVPLIVREGELGVLLLGHKLSGEIYTDQDLDLLKILSPEISIAIQNAKAYEEIKQFNIKLAKEVERATSDLVHANEKLKELDKLKDEFMSIASHELRTPMTAIKSYVWLSLHGKTQEKDPKVRSYLDRVFESSERMISMINDMLNVNRIETGRMKLDIIPISVWKVAEQVKEELAARAAESGLEIIIKKDNIVPLLMSDKDKLIEIFTNLIGNSIKFTHKGGKITVAARKTGTAVEVQVSDTGVGIAKENLDKLFKKYGKLNESYATASPSTGTGLGLYITKQYLEKMGGKIGADSIQGKGTTFTFSLPIAAGKDLLLHEREEVQPSGVILNPRLAKDPKFLKEVVKAEISRTPKKS